MTEAGNEPGTEPGADPVTDRGTESVSSAVVPLIELVDVSKEYPGGYAVQDVSFSVLPGEVHALVGENGAGKSTLCKIMAGVETPTRGHVQLNGDRVEFNSPRDALLAGVAMVYQEASLVPSMTVAQNMYLGDEQIFNLTRRVTSASQQLLQSMNFKVDPRLEVASLGAAKKQMVEIARAIRRESRVLIIDEPTASLTPEEVLHLFQTISDLKARGFGIVYVSHVLSEIQQIADRVTILRDGRLQVTDRIDRLGPEQVIRHMVGRDIVNRIYQRHEPVTENTAAEEVLRVEGLTGQGVNNMTFSAYAGEVVGVAGLIGSGRSEAAHIIAGIAKRNRFRGGMVYLNGRPVRYRTPVQAVRDGISYITEDRKLNGFFDTQSIDDNIYQAWLAVRRRPPLLATRARARKIAAPWSDRLGIRSVGRRASVAELSGGNQQKVVVAKALVQNPRVVIFDEPTRGVDVGAIVEIHEIIRETAATGAAVIVISSYLPEILSISDRILVARQGRIVTEASPTDATQESLMFAAIH